MPDSSKEVALRKRQQITKASRTMFLWVAGASIVIGASVVLLYVIGQKLVFNEKVLAEKRATQSALDHNLSIVEELKAKIRVLNTSEVLAKLRTNQNEEPVQVVLDALPATANSAALGASLQSGKLLEAPGVTIETLTVSPVAGFEDSSEDSSSDDDAGDNEIQFEFVVSASRNNPNALKNVLKRLERSIRAINITSMQLEQQDDRLQLTATGTAYFQPAKKIQLEEKVVRP